MSAPKPIEYIASVNDNGDDDGSLRAFKTVQLFWLSILPDHSSSLVSRITVGQYGRDQCRSRSVSTCGCACPTRLTNSFRFFRISSAAAGAGSSKNAAEGGVAVVGNHRHQSGGVTPPSFCRTGAWTRAHRRQFKVSAPGGAADVNNVA